MTAASNVLPSVKRQLESLQRRWSRLPRPWRLASMLAVLALAATLALQRHDGGSAEPVELLPGHEFATEELTRVAAAFAERGLSEYEIRQRCIYIPSGQFGTYFAALKEADAIPLDRDGIRGMMQDGSILESDRERESRWIAGKEQMLENMLRRMQGIEEAFVMIGRARSRQRGLLHASRSTMTVAVRASHSSPLPPHRAYAICEAVTGAVDNLTADDVIVADLTTSNVYRGGSTRWREEAAFAALKAEYEQQWSEKIKRALKFIPHVEVLTEVMLTRASQPDSRDLTDEDNPPDQADDDHSAAGDMWIPKRVSVTVSIPRSYVNDVWRSRQQSSADGDSRPSPDELAVIRRETCECVEQAVAGLSPMGGFVQLIPESRILWFDRPPGTASRPWTDRFPSGVASWLAAPRARMVFLSLLALAGVCLAWGVVRDVRRLLHSRSATEPSGHELRVVPSDSVPIHRPSAAAAAPAEPVPSEASSEPTYHVGLTELVRDDPQAAVSMLKSWLSKAG